MNILYIDIETTPILQWNWRAWGDQRALKIEEDWKVLGIAYAWNDNPVVPVYPTAKNRAKPGYYRKWDKQVTKQTWKLFDDADIVIAHNGDRFDIKKMRAKFIEHGLPPHSPILTIDTKKIASREFGFSMNNLDHLGQHFGFGNKLHHSGLQMWFNCMDGVPAAWDEMEEYNVIDTELLRKIYKHMRPWDTRHPNIGLGEGCSKCGSFDLMKRGVKTMQSGLQRQKYQCKNCGGYSTTLKGGQVRA